MKGLVLILSFITSLGYSQVSNDVNQYMVYQPFFNSASGASYDNVTVAGYYRNQWVGIDGAPENYGVNAVVPVSALSGVLGVKVFRDLIGANKRDRFSLGYTYRARLKENSYLAFGLDGVAEIQSRNLVGLDVAMMNDVGIVNTQNVFKPNAVFSSYLFNENSYIGLVFSELVHYEGELSSFSIGKMPIVIHAGREFRMRKGKQAFNVSSLLKTDFGAGLHLEVNSMYQFLDKKLGLGMSYRTSKDLVGILKLSPVKEFEIGYSYQYTFSKLSSYQNGSHELVLVYNMNRNKEMGKIYAPRF